MFGARLLVGLTILLATPTLAQRGAVLRFDASASYRCLERSPERTLKLPFRSRKLVFQVCRPQRIHQRTRFSNITTGTGWDFFATFEGGSLDRSYGSVTVNLWFFDQTRDAQAFYSAEVKGFTRKPLTLDRNVFINWGTATSVPPKQLRSIVVGCLRTH